MLETNQYETYGNVQANLRVDRNFDGNVRNYTGYLRYTAPDGQPVYLTHLARTLHGTQAELDATLPSPLQAAYDGLEVVFKCEK